MPFSTAGGYATFLGGGNTDEAFDIAVDRDGNVYVVGWTRSFDFPSSPGLRPLGGTVDGFLVKLDPDGNIVYATFFGGSSDYDGATGVAVNDRGEAHVTGWTSSLDFPTARPHQPSLMGRVNAFVARFNDGGRDLIYSTYFGGQDADGGIAIAVDPYGNAYVTGIARSATFPTTPGVLSSGPVRGEDTFVAKFTPDGELKYSTLLGGRACVASAIALGGGAAGGVADVFVTGRDFRTIAGVPVASPFTSGAMETFVARLDEAGASLRYVAYIGGRYDDMGVGIAVDGSDNAHVTGWTESDDFFTTDGTRHRFGPSWFGPWLVHHVFVARLDPSGSLIYSILVQGVDDDWGSDIAVADDVAFIAGGTHSHDFPVTRDALPVRFAYNSAFVAAVDSAGRVISATFFGSGLAAGIALDGTGNVHLTGLADADRFAVGTPRFAGGALDAFAVRLRWS